MKMPGFSAESSLRAKSGPAWSGPARPFRAAAGVVPAKPSCEACADACANFPNSRFCQGCRKYGCL